MVFVVDTNAHHRMGVDLSQSATDDHSREEQTSGYVRSVGYNGEEVPHRAEHNHLLKGAHDALAQNVAD